MEISKLLPMGILFVVIAIAMGLGSQVLGEIAEDQSGTANNCGLNATGGTGGTIRYTNCDYDYNSTANGLSAVDEVTGWLPTIALVVAASMIIGIVIMFLARRQM